jgi:putative transposase
MEGQNDYRRGRHVVSAMHVHLIFVTKYRRGVFDDEMPTRCEEIMRKVCEDFEAELKEFNGERDHVHLLVHYPPKVAVSKLVNSLKDAIRPPDTAGVHRPDQPRHHARTPAVTLILLRTVRRSTLGNRPPVHRAAKRPL